MICYSCFHRFHRYDNNIRNIDAFTCQGVKVLCCLTAMYVNYIEEHKFIITFVQHYKFVSMSKITIFQCLGWYWVDLLLIYLFSSYCCYCDVFNLSHVLVVSTSKHTGPNIKVAVLADSVLLQSHLHKNQLRRN